MNEDEKRSIDAFFNTPRTFVRVYRLPEKLTNGYCFGGGRPITFHNVDWFEAVIGEGREPLAAFIRTKRYFDPAARFLVLADHPDLTFTIEPARSDPGRPVPKHGSGP